MPHEASILPGLRRRRAVHPRARAGLSALLLVGAAFLAGCGMTTLPSDPVDRKDALGSVTMSTPLLTPVRPDAGRRLDLSKAYSVEAIKDELNKANMGLSTASLRSLSTALAITYAGPSIAQSATSGQTLAPDGTVTTTGESTRTVSQQTPEVPSAPSAGQPNEKALEALIGLLSRSKTDYQLPVGETMSLAASLHAYGVALEDYYNQAYLDPVVEQGVLLVEQRRALAQEKSRLTLRQQELIHDINSEFPGRGEEFATPALTGAQQPTDAFLDDATYARISGRFGQSVGQLAFEAAQTRQAIVDVEAKLNDFTSITIPYRMTFRIVASPGWFSQQNQLDVVADIQLTADSAIKCHFAGAVPAETTQTLDEFAATLRQLSNALELGGAYGPVAAKATVQRLAAKAERLEGLRSNTTFIAEFPEASDTLRLRFSPSVVGNASRRMLDRTGINVTALVLVEMPMSMARDFETPEALVATIEHRFEPTLRLVSGGKYKGPKKRSLRSTLDDARQDATDGQPQKPPLTRIVSLPPFAPDDRFGQLAFVAGATRSLTWIVNNADSSHTAKALITTKLVAPNAGKGIELALIGGSGSPSIRGGGAVSDRTGIWNIQPGNDIVIVFDVPANSLKATTDANKPPTITPFPVVLHASQGGRSIIQTVMVGASSGGSSGSGGSTAPK